MGNGLHNYKDMSLLIVTAFCNKDIDLAVGMFNWIGKLGGLKNNDVLLVTDRKTNGFASNRVLLAARRVAKSVERIYTTLEHNGQWPQGANAAFLETTQYARAKGRAFLWLEPDCVPIKAGWIDAIEAEYERCGSAYMGDVVPVGEAANGSKRPMGLMGVAVYPKDTAYDRSAPQNVPFDMHIGQRVIKQTHKSGLFQWFGGPGTRRDPPKSLANVRPGTVLFHADKTGNLIHLINDQSEKGKQLTRVIVGKVNNPNNQHKLIDVKITVPIFLQLGRIGDILNILPMLRFWSSVCFNKPVPILVHSKFAHVLSRIGYADVREYDGDINDLEGAKVKALSLFPRVLNCQLFSSAGVHKGNLSHYNLDQWDNCGQADNFHLFPLEIDNRNYAAERELVARFEQPNKPLVCYNLDGTSSPFEHKQKIEEMLKRK